MSTAPVLDAGRAFWRGTLTQLGCAAGAFTVTAAVVTFLLPADFGDWMRDTPLAVALAVASLAAAWLARWWADVDAPAPTVALLLHAVVQGAVLAPLGWAALAWLEGWAAGPAVVGLAAVVLAAMRVRRTHEIRPAAAALALSAAPAEPVWYAGGLLRSAVSGRD